MKILSRNALFTFFIAISILSPASFSLAADGKVPADSARNLWVSAFMKMKEADEALAAGKQVLALKLYQDANTSYKELRDTHADWKTEMVEYRLNYTAEKAKALEMQLRAAGETLAPEQLATMVASLKERVQQEEERAARAEETLQVTKDQLAAALRRLAEEPTGTADESAVLKAMKVELALLKDAKDEFVKLQKKHADLEGNYQARANELKRLQKQVDAVSKENRRLTESNEETAQIVAERNKLLKQLDSAQAELDLLKEKDGGALQKRLQKELGKRDETIADLEDAVDELQKEATGLEVERDALQQQVAASSALEDRCEELTEELDELRKEHKEELAELADDIAKLERTNAQLEELADQKTPASKADKKLRQAIAELDEVREELEIARKERKAFEKQFMFHKKLSEERAETIQKLKKELEVPAE